jgi:hypothetical protein
MILADFWGERELLPRPWLARDSEQDVYKDESGRWEREKKLDIEQVNQKSPTAGGRP